MFQGLTGWHAVIILAIILLLFGAPKLPALARSLGQSMKIFKSEVKTSKDDDDAAVGEAPSTMASTPAEVRAEGSQTQPKP